MKLKLWTLNEVQSLTGFSLSKIKRDVLRGYLIAKKIGASRRVLHCDLVAYLGFDPREKLEAKPEKIAV